MDIVTLSHGSGGKSSHSLINELFFRHFGNDILLQGNDAALLPALSGRIAVSTDSFVINPIFFEGGDIGKLAVCGTVNDVAMSGAAPLYISAGFIIEEGFPMKELETIVKSMARTAREAGVKIVTGDTKVVDRGSADKIYINTTGIGLIEKDIYIGGDNAIPGDKIIISGTLGDHGICIMSKRKNLEFDVPVKSDCGLLNKLIKKALDASDRVKVLRDPTRGGLAATLNEIARQSHVNMTIYENAIPVKEEVRSMCEILGFDPLYVANEGKVIIITAPEDAEKVLQAIRKDPMGKDACIIGEVTGDSREGVYLRTELGSTRVINMPAGELLPRIC